MAKSASMRFFIIGDTDRVEYKFESSEAMDEVPGATAFGGAAGPGRPLVEHQFRKGRSGLGLKNGTAESGGKRSFAAVTRRRLIDAIFENQHAITMWAAVGDHAAATYRPTGHVYCVFRLPIKFLDIVKSRINVRFGYKLILVRTGDFAV